MSRCVPISVELGLGFGVYRFASMETKSGLVGVSARFPGSPKNSEGCPFQGLRASGSLGLGFRV